MPFFKIGLVLFILGAMASFAVVDTNRAVSTSDAPATTANDSVAVGRQLALRHCGSCHLFPDPALLAKKTWVTGVLPNMGRRLGIKPPGQDTLIPLPPEEEKVVSALNVYPETAQLTLDDWQRIVSYYERMAPDEPLPQRSHASITNQLLLFRAREVSPGDKPAPQITLLKYDKNTARLYAGDAQNALYVLDEKLQPGKASLTDTWWIDTPPTDIDFPKNAPPRLLTIGLFSPSDQRLGRLMTLDRNAKPGAAPVNIRELPRPVQFTTGDLNADGKEDVIVCGFGNNTGKLFWYDGFDSAKEHVLKATPGARRVELADFNRDGKPDIIALMAQAREEVTIFYNQGRGRFTEKTVLRFSPVFGSSYFELVDFNHDGFQDILLTNGDNWDYSASNKPYHGVRIYLNDRNDNFREAWFYPLYGASKAVARDFDGDGDVDIAATSFYASLDQPEQGFIYFKNIGKLAFTPFSTPEAANGKWLTMEAADFDRDGDVDIVLGSYFHTVGEMTQLLFKGITSFPQLLVLENQTK